MCTLYFLSKQVPICNFDELLASPSRELPLFSHSSIPQPFEASSCSHCKTIQMESTMDNDHSLPAVL